MCHTMVNTTAPPETLERPAWQAPPGCPLLALERLARLLRDNTPGIGPGALQVLCMVAREPGISSPALVVRGGMTRSQLSRYLTSLVGASWRAGGLRKGGVALVQRLPERRGQPRRWRLTGDGAELLALAGYQEGAGAQRLRAQRAARLAQQERSHG